jgi:glycosyltransferase involved in cell wall biosynthesis
VAEIDYTGMRLVYDYQVFSIQAYGGISRYITELAAGVSRVDGIETTILALAHINRHLDAAKELQALVIGKRIPEVQRTWRIRTAINGGISRLYLRKLQPDIVHETYYSEVPVVPENIPTVITVHDMIHEKHPKYFDACDDSARAKAASVRRADRVICVSAATQDDVIEFYNLDPRKISVIHHGFSLRVEASDLQRSLVTAPYILYVGTRTGYKNFHNLLMAYARSPRIADHYQLICFGGGEFSPADQRLMNNVLKIRRGRVRQVKGTDKTLANLYRYAEALVYPSEDEGFGIPLLEAMSLGCPVVCSDIDVFKEVAGEAAEYVDPSTTESIAAGVEHVLGNMERRHMLRELGYQRIGGFSWQRCAAETIQVYRELV